jgi:phospholipid-binding lipoprotein MlaA
MHTTRIRKTPILLDANRHLGLLVGTRRGTTPLRILPGVAIAAIVLATAACGGGHASGEGVANDPYEANNRSFFASHQVLYKNVIRPVAVFYNHAVPELARDGIHNFLVNIDLPVTFGNDLLQGEVLRSGETLARFAVNSTAGIGGVIDVARKIGVPEHETSFADTMADYDVGEGPYLFVPVIGPSVPRELVGKVVDSAFDPLTYVTYGASILVSVGRAGATFVDKRARGAATADEIERVSSDPYATTRLLYERHLAAEANHTAPDSDFDSHPDDVRMAAQESQDTPAAIAAVAPAAGDVGAYCSSVAQARASDAAASGYEADTQQAVHDGVYKDCVNWHAAHRGMGDISTHVIALR